MNRTKTKIIRNWEGIKKVVGYCKTTGYCSFDFETHALGPHHEDESPTLVGISFQPGSAYTIPLDHTESPFKKDWKKVLFYLAKELFENRDIIKVAQNAKFEHSILLKHHLTIRGPLFDTMLAKYLLDEERPFGLKEMVARFLPEFAGYDDENKNLVKKYGWGNIPLKPLSTYCGQDCDYTLRLMIMMEKQLIKHNFYYLFRNMLMMASRVLVDTEDRGMIIDTDYLEYLDTDKYTPLIADLHKKLLSSKTVQRMQRARRREHIDILVEDMESEIEDIRKKLRKAKKEKDEKAIKSANTLIKNREAKLTKYLSNPQDSDLSKKEKFGEFNFGSPAQLIHLFYTHPKGFECPILDYTDSGAPSTAEDTLIKLLALAKDVKRKPLVNLITSLLELRGLQKLHSTYIVGLKEKLTNKGHLHCNYLIHGTVTGRLSSRDPNLQNIPRATTNSDIKKMFIPPKGYIFLEVDYSQAELRVVAEISRDKNMISIFKRGYNIHLATGLKMEGILDEATYKLANSARKDPNHPDHVKWIKIHKKGKATNFSILYGQSDAQLAETLKCSKGDAALFKKEWFKAYPGVTKWINRQQNFVQLHGFVYSLWGRKRRLPDALRKGEKAAWGFYNKALRDCINAPIQGASNDFTLFASILIREARLQGKLPWDLHQCYTVHDSLGFWIQPKDLEEVLPKLMTICENPQTEKYFGFETKHVEMKVSGEVGKTWIDLQEVKPGMDYKQWLKDDDYFYNKN